MTKTIQALSVSLIRKELFIHVLNDRANQSFGRIDY